MFSLFVFDDNLFDRNGNIVAIVSSEHCPIGAFTKSESFFLVIQIILELEQLNCETICSTHKNLFTFVMADSSYESKSVILSREVISRTKL